MTAAAMSRSLVQVAPDLGHPVLLTALQVVTVAACLALCAAFAQGMWMIAYPQGKVIVCTDVPGAC